MGPQRFELPRWECITLVRSEAIGRLCLIDHGYPLAIPVNYRLVEDGTSVWFMVRTSPDTPLGQYEGPSSLEIDHTALGDGSAWSVIVRGRLQRVDGAHALPEPEPLVTESRDRWMVLEPIGFTGRKFRNARGADDFQVEWQLQPA